MRQVLLLNAGEAILNKLLIGFSGRLFTQMLDSADEEAAGAAGGVEQRFAQARIDLLDDELRDRARGVELTRVAGRLKIFKQFLINVAKHMAVIRGVEVDAVNLVDNLPHQGAVLHVVVGVFKGGANQA